MISPAAGGELNGGAKSAGVAIEFARCFLRLANLPNFALDRLSRYEATLLSVRPAGTLTRLRCWIAVSPRSDRTMFGSSG